MSVNINGYALALFELAREAKALKAYKRDSQIIVSLLDESPRYVHLISNPDLTRAERAKLVSTAFRGAEPLLLNMLAILAERTQLRHAAAILRKFIALVNAFEGTNEGVIYSAELLSKATLQAITKRVSRELKLNALVLTNKLDPSLIAGFRVEVKDEVIEDSVPSRLAALRNTLMAKDVSYGN